MIQTIMMTLARQRLASPMRFMLVIAVFGIGMFTVLLSGSLGALDKSAMGMFGFVIAAGLIGQEVSSGVLTLAFARPMRRAEYVLGRWLGACTLAGGLVVVQVLVAILVTSMRHGVLTPALVATKLVEGTLASVGAAAILLMFSSLAAGLGDLALFVFASLIGGLITTVGGHYHLGWLRRAGEEAQRFLGASLDAAPFFGQGTVSWFAIASYLSTLSICLAVAIWAVNRKELSYASG